MAEQGLVWRPATMATKTVKEKEKRLADLTVGEFDALMDLMMQKMLEKIEELFFDLEQQLPDPDEGLEFKPEVAERLRAFLKEENPRGTPLEDVVRELGLDD
jgi:hypothetical protein